LAELSLVSQSAYLPEMKIVLPAKFLALIEKSSEKRTVYEESKAKAYLIIFGYLDGDSQNLK
jgi:hypothetical protein